VVPPFGISPLWVFPLNQQNFDGYREYHHMCPTVQPDRCADRDESVGIGVYHNQLLELFAGFMMAGPKLTPQSYAQGQYNYPATGGSAAYPLWKMTPDSPVWIKDFTEVWWNANGSGKDEVNQNNVGILMKAAGGKRYQANQWPTTNPTAFDPNGAVFTTDAPYVGPNVPTHEQDGHKHPATEKCLSCK